MALLSVTVALSAHAVGAGAAPSLSDLRCEYLLNPLAVETKAPRLSWNTVAEGRDWRQAAYQILVASDAAALARNRGDLWDSGRVASDASIQIPYAGKALGSRQRCFWKVRVWDRAGNASDWSKAQTWEMGLLNEADWQASAWIGIASDSKKGEPAPFLRKAFTVNGKPKRARLYASGLGYAELHLNGKKLGGASERDPGYTNFDKRVLYVTHDVTSAIKPGPNALGAVLGTGWYDVHDLATWRFENAPWRGRPRMKLVLYLDYADGRTETIVSDPSWKASRGPIRFDGIYTGEVYDAREELPQWSTPGYDDAKWKAADVMAAPKGKVATSVCPPVAIIETIKPVRILEPRPGVFVYDFGQNIAGHARLRVKGPAGTKVTMRYSERVDAKGEIQRATIDHFMDKTDPPQPFQTDVYICKGIGTEVWEQRFSYSGFQYVEVTGFPGKPNLKSLEARLAATDLESGGEFECSNDLFNKIQRATRYAYYSNAQNIPTDCPQREKNGWTGDAHLACEAGLMNFRSASFYTKWLDDLSDDQRPDGEQSLIVPSGGWGVGGTHPAWDSAYPIIARDLYLYRGDTRALATHYDKLKRYVDNLTAQTKDGIVPFDSLGDWLPWKAETSSKLTSTAFLYLDAKIIADAARMQGNVADVNKYTALAEKTKAAYLEQFLRPEMLETHTQTALAISIYFGLAEGELKQAAFDALLRNLERTGHLDTGILGAKYVIRVLAEAGRNDLAFKIVNRKEQPGWGWWIAQGGTTLYEDWKGEASLNHIMFGDVSNWFFQWIAGIGLDPAAPAFKHILIRPQPVGDLTWAKATERSPYGKIASSWTKKGTAFQLDIEIPANTTATVTVPGTAKPTEGARLVKQESGATTFEVGPGRYRFDSKL